MKESITKFDLESAFKALDEIEIPQAEKVRANRPALTEIFSNKTKFDALMEEYYDISSNEGLEDAKDAREAEIAQAKLDRIEKIVDLDAESAEDLLTSYVGKFILQCPQCMTLFYKNPEDVVASEEDPTTVNVNEVCQHCGNESGYSLIGKVGEAEPEVEEESVVEEGELDLNLDDTGATEETAEEVSSEEDLNFDDELEEFDLDSIEDDVEEEKKEESFAAHTGEALVEDLSDDKDLDAKLDAHNEYIEYLRTAIAQEEDALEKTENAQVKDAIQRRIDAFKADLEAALPEAVKNDEAIAEESVEEPIEVEETATEEPVIETEEVNESLTEGFISDVFSLMDKFGKDRYLEILGTIKEVNRELEADPKYLKNGKRRYLMSRNMPMDIQVDYLCNLITRTVERLSCPLNDVLEVFEVGLIKDFSPEAVAQADERLYQMRQDGLVEEKTSETIHEDTDTDVSDAEFEQLMHSSEFKKPISDTAVRAMLAMDDNEEAKKEESLDAIFSGVEELQEADLEHMISDSLIEMYGNVAGFRLKECSYANSKFMVEGVIHFTSGNTRKLTYTFNEALVKDDKITLRGLNEKLGSDKQFFIVGRAENKTLITESFKVAKN